MLKFETTALENIIGLASQQHSNASPTHYVRAGRKTWRYCTTYVANLIQMTVKQMSLERITGVTKQNRTIDHYDNDYWW